MLTLKFIVPALAIGTVIGVGTASGADMTARPYTKAPVMAADPGYNWSGFYIGGHVGYLWGKTRVVDDGILTESGAPTNGVIGGVLAGYNWQTGPLVLGIEGDFGWTNAVGHGIAGMGMVPDPPAPPSPAPPPPPIIITNTTTTTTQAPNTYELRWASHVVGKVGYASGSWLFFATGGLGIADLNFLEGVTTVTTVTTTTTVIPKTNQITGGVYTGFSVGGGVEYAFSRNLLGRLQYIYDDFGSKNYVSTDGGIYRVSLTAQTFRGALSWKF